MKKILIGLIILMFYSCSTTNNTKNITVDKNENKTERIKDYTKIISDNVEIVYDYAGIVDNEQLDFIQKKYKWETSDILIINFKQPLSSCHFDNNQINSTTEKFWTDFYSKINIENCSNIFVLSNGERVKKKLDNKKYFDDKDDFLLQNFFNRKKSCFGVFVMNKDGHYIQYNGHYSERQVAKFIENLKI